jgi:hypothetical protein
MRRLACIAVVAVAALAAGSAQAGDTVGQPPNPILSRILGMVPTFNGAFKATNGFGQLRNHNGPVMKTNQTFAIFWQPSNWSRTFPSTYAPLVTRYFGDVAADSGKTSNVYYAATQYSGIAYSSSYGGSVTVTDPLPASGCSDSAASVCLSDAQLQTEIKTVIARQGWTSGANKLYFLFTAPGVGSCMGSSSCAFTQYCAYHSWIGSGTSATLYANQPYVDGVSGCDAGYHPNGGAGDAVLNVVSHEHNEAITDPQGNAWYDILGYENGDKCAWSWGTLTGSGASAYNQTVNGHHYILQLEYSNASRGCAQTGT